MSYTDELVKLEQPASAELYEIIIGNGMSYMYVTSFGEVVEFLGREYQPIPITRGSYSFEPSLKTITLDVTMPITGAFANYLSSAPFQATIVNLYHVFLSNPNANYTLLFSGAVNSIQVNNLIATVRIEANNAVLSKKIPRVFWQSTCNHSLFDSSCGVARHLYRKDVHVTGVNFSTVTINENVTDGYYTAGTMCLEHDERLITKQSGKTFYLMTPFDSRVTVGTVVEIYPGCSGDPQMCKGKFRNIINFCGMPYIPTKNALLWGFR
jgi:uncharacterized phage protein (TIGR02218 family)